MKNQTSFKKGHLPFKRKPTLSTLIHCSCDYCGINVIRKPSQYYIHQYHFCSVGCRILFNKFLISDYYRNIATKQARMSIEDQKIRFKARHAVAHAIEKGLLCRLPCVVCGDEKTDAHHNDYARPLDVVWLCNRHHNEIHVKIRKEKENLVKAPKNKYYVR